MWSLKTLPPGFAESPDGLRAVTDRSVHRELERRLRWDGTQWQKMTLPTFPAGSGEQPGWGYVAGPARPRP